MGNDRFDPIARPVIIGRAVTGTITLVCVLIVYDGWAKLRLIDVVGIVLGPIAAIFISHVFSGSLVQHVELGRRPTGSEWFTMLQFESRFLLLAVPPLVILLILDIAGGSLAESIRVIIWLEALSLSFWAGLAGYRAGLRGRALAVAVLGGLVVSALVVAIQVALQPGDQVQGSLEALMFIRIG
jgi:hypothetical protein